MNKKLASEEESDKEADEEYIRELANVLAKKTAENEIYLKT